MNVTCSSGLVEALVKSGCYSQGPCCPHCVFIPRDSWVPVISLASGSQSLCLYFPPSPALNPSSLSTAGKPGRISYGHKYQLFTKNAPISVSGLDSSLVPQSHSLWMSYGHLNILTWAPQFPHHTQWPIVHVIVDPSSLNSWSIYMSRTNLESEPLSLLPRFHPSLVLGYQCLSSGLVAQSLPTYPAPSPYFPPVHKTNLSKSPHCLWQILWAIWI